MERMSNFFPLYSFGNKSQKKMGRCDDVKAVLRIAYRNQKEIQIKFPAIPGS